MTIHLIRFLLRRVKLRQQTGSPDAPSVKRLVPAPLQVLLCLLAFLALGSERIGAGSQPRVTPGWSVTQQEGVHWLVTPDGKLFYSKGVNFIDPGKDTPASLQKQAFYWKNFFSSVDDWRHSAAAHLSGSGFNTRGGWSDASPELTLPLTVDLELGRNSKFHWFDPFDPSMEQHVMERAEQLTAPYRNDPLFLGYFSDNEVGWWNSALFEWYIGKGWENHTKRVLWQLLHDHYGGRWDCLLENWVPEAHIKSFEDLKQGGTRLKLRPGGDGIRMVGRFTYLCARHYYQLMFRGIRKAHPGALVLGDRLPLYYNQDAVLAIGDNIDVISTNYNLDAADGWVAPYYFDGLRRLSQKPVLISEFFFAAEENRTGNRNETARNKYPKPGHLMTVQTQAERARGAANAIRGFARFPNVVGAHWFQYCDEPMGGREDGEDYNMGLIDTAGRPYEEITEMFRSLNPQLEAHHRQSTENPMLTGMQPGGPHPITLAAGQTAALARAESPIDVSDQSLLDWSKEQTLLKDFQTPSPYVPFGDVHVTWTPEGIYLASIANTYVNPTFLSYEGEFPSSEAFQLHLSVEIDGKLNHFAIYLIPHDAPLLPDGFDVSPRLYRLVEGKPSELLPAPGHVQRINKSLPHMHLEAFFPAQWLGLKELQTGMKLRMNVALMSYYRELTMTWAGSPTLRSLEDPGSLRTIVLKDSEGKEGIQPKISLR
jgi:hypothetical protein